jgi:segregation and condensation protein A
MTTITAETNHDMKREEGTFIKVYGEPYVELPHDLYIPPDALEIFLDAFQGPLDLLLYLIRKQNIDILDIPIAAITQQYMHYVDLMKTFRLELAAEYLVMAAMLAEIKSRLLLPKSSLEEVDDDPRADLVRRLQEYEQIKQAAESLDSLEHLQRDFFYGKGVLPALASSKALPTVSLQEVVFAFYEVLNRAELTVSHHIEREPLSVRERMRSILDCLQSNRYMAFQELFQLQEGRRGVVISFIALLELVKASLVEVVQNSPMSPLHIKAR